MGESRAIEGRLMTERALGDPPRSGTKGAQPARSLSVNLAESPLGWLYARGHVSERQFLAGERLRWDWERAQLDPCVTMRWDAAPRQRGRGGSAVAIDPSMPQLAARERSFEVLIDLPSGSYTADWINPKTGTVDKSQNFSHAGGGRSLGSPLFSEDLALRIRRQ